tara:strand:- start:1991 stop:2182 length:192 start_codon:yes stop_codon:yes gene_type:complete
MSVTASSVATSKITSIDISTSTSDSTPDIDTINELLLDADGLYNALHLDADGLGVTLLEDKKQ